jgi:hypothetical protein
MPPALLEEGSMVGVVVACVLVAAVALYFALFSKPSSKATGAPADSTTAARPKPQGPFTVAEVAKHNTVDDAWIIIEGKVYDITECVQSQPPTSRLRGYSVVGRIDASMLAANDDEPWLLAPCTRIMHEVHRRTPGR